MGGAWRTRHSLPRRVEQFVARTEHPLELGMRARVTCSLRDVYMVAIPHFGAVASFSPPRPIFARRHPAAPWLASATTFETRPTASSTLVLPLTRPLARPNAPPSRMLVRAQFFLSACVRSVASWRDGFELDASVGGKAARFKGDGNASPAAMIARARHADACTVQGERMASGRCRFQNSGSFGAGIGATPQPPISQRWRISGGPRAPE